MLFFSYFEEVLQSENLPVDHTEVKLLKDGTWSVLMPEDELHRASSPSVSTRLYQECNYTIKSAIFNRIQNLGQKL